MGGPGPWLNFRLNTSGPREPGMTFVEGLFISCSVKVPFIDLNKQLDLTEGSPPPALNQGSFCYTLLLCKFELKEGSCQD